MTNYHRCNNRNRGRICTGAVFEVKGLEAVISVCLCFWNWKLIVGKKKKEKPAPSSELIISLSALSDLARQFTNMGLPHL